MAKDKSKTGIPNKHLHARISFLQQAATYLTAQGRNSRDTRMSPSSNGANQDGGSKQRSKSHDLPSTANAGAAGKDETKQQHPVVISNLQAGGLPLYLNSHLAQVARKSQIRLHANIKHTICKRCSTVLVEGSTCRKFVENLSKGGKKPQADVLVVECGACGAQKRWPVGVQRQRKKIERKIVIVEEKTGCKESSNEQERGRDAVCER